MLPEAPDSVTENLEAEIAILAHATIRCAHVCRLIGTCVVEGTCALVMKLYECSLHDLLEGTEQRKLPLGTALRVATELAHAVGELHECKIIVRDLKPANVLLDKWGGVVVSDFGISSQIETMLSRVMPTSIKGTTCYMPPEAFDPDRTNSLSLDQYIAMTLFLLNSKRVFEAFDATTPENGLIKLDFNQFVYAAAKTR